MTSRVTLKDVAIAAGVHTSTASRALNPATRSVVNARTVDKVLSAARSLGYSPHPLARGLRTNTTMSIGMVIPDIENPLFGAIVAGAEPVLGEAGYSLLVVNGAGDDERTSEAARALIERRVDGLILATATRDDAVVRELLAGGTHIVLVNRSTDGAPVPAIIGDDQAGIGLAVEHLFTLGHRSIGHVAGPRHFSTGLGRYQAFLSWSQSLGLEVRPDAVEEASAYQVEPGFDAARKLLDRRPDLTAIVAANDLIGLGCYRAVRESGREIPGDVSVTGYNDIPLLDLMQPPLTSVKVSYREMGAEAGRTLLSSIGTEPTETRPVSILLAPMLSVRGSTAPPS